MGIEDEKTFMQKYGSKEGLEPGDESGLGSRQGSGGPTLRGQGTGENNAPTKINTRSIDFEKAVGTSIDYLIGSVLGGTIDPKIMKDNLLKLKPHLNGAGRG